MLDLDLDVFAGPFDLLLTLVLREEVDLLEVDLAEVVLAYVDHLEARGELDLEAATEFLVLIAALLELKSRLMLPGRGARSCSTSSPARRPRSCSRGMLECAPLPRRGRRTCRSGSSAEHGFRYRSAPLPPQLRRAPLEARRGGLRPDAARRGARRPAARCRRRSTCATSRSPRVSVAERLGAPARAAARAGRFTFDEAVARRRPHDRRGDAVRAARALQARRGDWEQAEPFGEITIERRDVAGRVSG